MFLYKPFIATNRASAAGDETSMTAGSNNLPITQKLQNQKQVGHFCFDKQPVSSSEDLQQQPDLPCKPRFEDLRCLILRKRALCFHSDIVLSRKSWSSTCGRSSGDLWASRHGKNR